MTRVVCLLATALILSSYVTTQVRGARILALMVTPSRSHHIWNRSLMLALAARGHQVTVLSPDREKSKPGANFTEMIIEGAYEYANEAFNYVEWGEIDGRALEMMLVLFDWGTAMCKHGLASPAAQSLWNSDQQFDLIITEIVLEECFLAFLHKFNYPPIMAMTAWSSPNWVNTILGNSDNPSYIPDIQSQHTDHMTFTERAWNLVINLYTQYHRQWRHLPNMDKLVRENFGSGVPSVSELERRISLILVNQHISMDYARPLLPTIVPVAGMHIKPCQPLPADIQKWLDEAENGAIFFSLGSNLRSDQLGSSSLSTLLAAFSELPQRILWKFESDTLQGQPANVKLGKWLPQNDILCHPNGRLFITHGGLLSTQESVHRGVPVVGVPFAADQHINTAKVVNQGVGVKLDFATLTKGSILKAVRTVINTPSYRSNMQRLSLQFRDQPQSPLERAVFWVEYMIRHHGAPHLRSAALDLAWYQILLLDVMAAILVPAAAMLALLWLALRRIGRRFTSKKIEDKKKCN